MTRIGPDPSLFRPYPELAEPDRPDRPYTIRESSEEPGLPSRGAVDRRLRRMWVPLEEHGRCVNRHEVGHACFSPLVLPRVSFELGVLAAVEDARVNLGLERAGVPSNLDFESEAYVLTLAARDVKRRDAFALFQRAVASIGTSAAPVLARVLERVETPHGDAIAGWVARVDRTLRKAAERRRAVAAPFDVGLALARAIARELRAHGILDAEGRARTPSVIHCCVGSGESGLLDLTTPLARRRREAPDDDAVVEPGALRIRSAPLPVALRARGGVRSWRAASEGSVVRYAHRWATDRAVFRRRVRVRGGTLLVDRSGSMTISVEDFDRFLAAAPIGTRVAIYGGEGAGGELRVVAEGGRRAAAEDLGRIGRGNVVDLPALEWLARQRAPRIWVSDGGVTGIGDRFSAALSARCEAVRRRAQIRRVENLEEARAVFGAP